MASRPSRTAATPRARRARLATAAPYANVSVRTLRRWIAEGRLPGYRLGPKLIEVDLDDLDRITRRIPTAGEA